MNTEYEHSTRHLNTCILHFTFMQYHSYHPQDFEADDLGGLLAVVVANAAGSEEVRGRLGPLNWLGDRLLYLAHKARPNTVAGE